MKCLCRVLPVALLASMLPACASAQHAMPQPADGEVQVCHARDDQASKMRTAQPRTGKATTRTIRTHMCPDCKPERSICAEVSILKAKCASCAPEDVDCDRLVPRQDTN